MPSIIVFSLPFSGLTGVWEVFERIDFDHTDRNSVVLAVHIQDFVHNESFQSPSLAETYEVSFLFCQGNKETLAVFHFTSEKR